VTTRLAELKRAHLFHLLDLDGNGFIERADFDHVVQKYAQFAGWGPDSKLYEAYRGYVMGVWDALSAGADTDHSGSVSPTEFIALFSQLESFPDQVAEMATRAFDVLDRDGDGTISLEEYRAFREAYGVDNADAAEHFARLDANNDSLISRAEFTVLMKDFFLSDDPEAPGSLLFGDF
jgi:juvenile hormone diol kinase